MSTMNLEKKHNIHWMFGTGLALALLVVVLLPIGTQARTVDPPPRPTSVIPPRPTAAPTLEPEQPRPRQSPPATGGYIELEIHPSQNELWTVVQWQDNYSNWHDVEGWQGTPREEQKTVLWWVAKKDLGTGPFRWVIYECQGCRIVATSAPFDLPESVGQRLVVEVSF